jgi:hypothetical protein
MSLQALPQSRGQHLCISGQDHVATYAAGPPYKYNRCFCKTCGTALGEIASSGESFPVSANCLDEDPGVRNRFHEFVAEKPDWYDICDAAKQFEAHPVKASDG